MAKTQHLIRAEIDPNNPLPELVDVINAVMACQPNREAGILQGLSSAIDKRLAQLKGAEKRDDEQVRESSRDGHNQG